MNRRILSGAVATVAALSVGAASLLGSGAGAQEDENDDAQTAVTTVAVERTDLVEREDLDGTLGYGDARDLKVNRPGTITALPDPGAVIERGGSVAEIDGLVVPLLYGTRPLWRSLQDGVKGPDVQILEENLVALGYADASSLTVDESFTSSTTIAVKRWQKALGLAETGVVQPTDAVVQPGAVRVAARTAEVGDPAGGPVLSVTGTARQVTIALPADRQGIVATGDAVQVELPDGSFVPATVSSVGTVVTPGDQMAGTSSSIEVIVTLDDAASGGALDQAPVDVSVVKSQATDVLAVPVEALVALAEGGYALELADGTLVAVTTGAFADGRVEIEGDIAEGDEVVVPA